METSLGVPEPPLIGAGQEPAADDEHCAEREESEVPSSLIDARAFAYVVNREDLVIHDALDEVEEAPPDEHPARESPAANCPARKPSWVRIPPPPLQIPL
jgi:hypothetical protein